MSKSLGTTALSALSALRHLSREEIEQRLAEIDSERAALSLLRRSLVARDRARKITTKRQGTRTNG